MIIDITEFDLSVLSPGETRPSGPHVSHIIRDIDNKLINKGLRPLDTELDAQELKRMGNYRGAGFVWERVVEWALSEGYRVAMGEARRDFPEIWPDRPDILKQDFIKKDGIWLKPDALDIKPWILEEYKLTWRKIQRLDDIETDFFTWLMQIKSYCLALETNKCNLFTFFVNGDYRDSGPQARKVKLTFTDQELEENWDMLLHHYRRNMK